MLFLENSASSLLTIHLLLAGVTLAGLGAGFVQIIKKEHNWRKINRFVIIGSLGYILTWVFGLLIYPTGIFWDFRNSKGKIPRSSKVFTYFWLSLFCRLRMATAGTLKRRD